MALPHKSIATIEDPEFINLIPSDISPLVSKCEIKVLYLGENRNGSYISKDVATEMAKSLRGCPIVGYFKQENDDFRDHGHEMIIDADGIHFNTLTRPYGFVAPNAPVWFKKFNEDDGFGNTVERQYLMTTGLLWTGQFEEAKKAIEEKKPQSMELDEKTLKGDWAENSKTGMEFFIISDAIFSKLCILGDDIEPCFEGASVTAPEISATFSKDVDANFKRTLFTMMNELKEYMKGEQQEMSTPIIDEKEMSVPTGENKEFSTESQPVEDQVNANVSTQFSDGDGGDGSGDASGDSTGGDTSGSGDGAGAGGDTTGSGDNGNGEGGDPSNTGDNGNDNGSGEGGDTTGDAGNTGGEGSNEGGNNDEPSGGDEIIIDDGASSSSHPGQTITRKTDEAFELLKVEHSELQTKFAELENEVKELREFKANVENEKKDQLIEEFSMLSDEDKKDVIENKANYSLEDIKAKLSVICFEKKVNFDLSSNSKNENTMTNGITTYNVDHNDTSIPDWVKEVKETEKTMNIGGC